MPDHPVVKQEFAGLTALDQQMNALADGIRNSIRNQYQTAEAQESQLESTVNGLKGDRSPSSRSASATTS